MRKRCLKYGHSLKTCRKPFNVQTCETKDDQIDQMDNVDAPHNKSYFFVVSTSIMYVKFLKVILTYNQGVIC